MAINNLPKTSDQLLDNHYREHKKDWHPIYTCPHHLLILSMRGRP